MKRIIALALAALLLCTAFLQRRKELMKIICSKKAMN